MGAVTGITDVGGYHYLQFHAPGNETATTGTMRGHFTVPAACQLFEVSVVSGAAITGANTNTRHINVIAPSGTELATRDLVSGTDMAANTAYAIYSSATGVALAAGDMIIVENEKIGTGQAAPGGFSVRAKIAWK